MLGGCAEAPKPEPTPAATPATLIANAPVSTPPVPAATIALVAAPVATGTVATGDLGKAKTSLETALKAWQTKNYLAAAVAVDAAGKELSAAANNTKLPEAVKGTLTKTSERLAPLKTMIEKKEPGVEEGLAAVLASVNKLSVIVSVLSGSGPGLPINQPGQTMQKTK